MSLPRVLVTGSNGTIGRAIVAEYRKHGYEVIEHTRLLADLSKPSGRSLLLKLDCDVLVNNAGASLYGARRVQHKLRSIWEVDVAATIDLTLRTKATSVVNMGWASTEWDRLQTDTARCYAAGKGAVMAFTRSFASLGKKRVNCIAPGWVKNGKAGNAGYFGAVWRTPEYVAELVREVSASNMTGMVIEC